MPDIVWDVARRALAGADLTVATGHGPLAWHVPDANQCKACHLGPDKTMVPIGPKLRNLNVGEQLAAAGVVVAAPAGLAASPDYRDAGLAVEVRARVCLDANCGHCHAPGHPEDTSGLCLNPAESAPLRMGIGKRPVAAVGAFAV